MGGRARIGFLFVDVLGNMRGGDLQGLVCGTSMGNCSASLGFRYGIADVHALCDSGGDWYVCFL